MTFAAEEIEKRIGYVFRNKELLKTAFTHSTYANTYGTESNERMEYLGDAVLGYVIAKKTYFENGKLGEGDMTKKRSSLVKDANLLIESEELGLKKYLLYVGGEKNIGKKTISSLFEAVIAAIWLDGGIEPCEAFILGRLKSATSANYKGLLQEYLQGRGKQRPEYKELSRTGTDDKPRFSVSASAEGVTTEGEGGRIQEAEQAAAKKLLALLKKGKK